MTAFLKEQCTQYQSHLLKQKKLNGTLHFQRNIKYYKSIPKQYLPPSSLEMPTNDNASLVAEFTQAYEDIFFLHLDKVITHNTISLELEESHLRNINTHVKKHLSRAGWPAKVMTELLTELFSESNIPHHIIEEALQRIMPATTTTGLPDLTPPPPPPPLPSTSTQPSTAHSISRRKRKHSQKQKAAKKAKHDTKSSEAVHSPTPTANDTCSFLSQRSRNKNST